MTDFKEINDNLLVLQLNNGEVRAFDALFYKYSDKLYRFSYSLLKNQEDSKEIVQETFLKIWDKRKEIDSFRSVKSFIFTICYNLIIDQLRSRLKERDYRKYLEEHFSSNNSHQSNQLDCEILQKRVGEALEKLPARRRQIYILSREKGLSHKKIASQLNIKEKTVENHITLALKQIKLSLGKDYLPFLILITVSFIMFS